MDADPPVFGVTRFGPICMRTVIAPSEAISHGTVQPHVDGDTFAHFFRIGQSAVQPHLRGPTHRMCNLAQSGPVQPQVHGDNFQVLQEVGVDVRFSPM